MPFPSATRKSPKTRKRSPIPETFRDGDAPQEQSARNNESSGTLRAVEMLTTPTKAHPPRSLRQNLSNSVHVGPAPRTQCSGYEQFTVFYQQF